MTETFKIGDPVQRGGSEYVFDGVVVGVVTKLSGATRYVVENRDAALHIFSAGNLERRRAGFGVPGYWAALTHKEWFSLPFSLRQRWTEETGMGAKAPSPALFEEACRIISGEVTNNVSAPQGPEAIADQAAGETE